MKIKWCVSDIDGTLTNSKRKIDSKVIDAIHEYESRGGVFILATGRTLLTAREIILQIGVSSPVITGNGSVIADGQGKILQRMTIDAEASLIAAAYALENRFDFIAFLPDSLWHPPYSVRVKYYAEKTPLIPLRVFSNAEELPHGEIIKFFFWNMDQKLVENFKYNCNSARLLNCVQSVRGTLDIDPKGATKGNGVRFLAQHLGLSTDNAAAFGDNMNDCDMLKSVGYPVAVGNAEEELKRFAKHICPSNDEYGVAVTLRNFMTVS